MSGALSSTKEVRLKQATRDEGVEVGGLSREVGMGENWRSPTKGSLGGLPGSAAEYHRKQKMPYINVQITKGATREQKAEIVGDITESLVRVLGKQPEHIHIVIQEIEECDWGFAGMLTDDWKKRQV